MGHLFLGAGGRGDALHREKADGGRDSGGKGGAGEA